MTVLQLEQDCIYNLNQIDHLNYFYGIPDSQKLV